MLLSLFTTVAILPDVARANTLFVGGVGSGNYTTIQDAIDDASPEDTVFVFDGTYLERVLINKTLTVIGENRETTVVDPQRTGPAFRLSADWVNLSGFTASNSTSAAIIIYSDSCHVTDNIVLGYIYGVSVEAGDWNVIANNAISEANIGVRIFASKHVEVLDNVFSDELQAVSLDAAEHVTIRRNVMNEEGIVIYGSSLKFWNTHSIDETNLVSGYPVRYWKNVTGGSIPSGAGQVILANCTTVIVENQSFSSGTYGLQLGFSSWVVIRDNHAPDNDRGIYLSFSDNNTIARNTLEGSRGISLYKSWNNEIEFNTVSTRADGILLLSSHWNAIMNNTVTSEYDMNGGLGTIQSGNNTILYNDFSDCGQGLFIHDSSFDNTIAFNVIRSSKNLGFNLGSSHGNIIHHNNILDNFKQARDYTDTNHWDAGYPSGGNHWSDYSGVDQFSGPNQDQPGSDGIGDTPYVIDADSQDSYPLMTPVALPEPPSAPRNLQAVAGDGEVMLDWDVPDSHGSSPIVNYRVYRGKVPGGEEFIIELGDVTSHLDSGLNNGETYYYIVTAKNEEREGPPSNEVSATPIAAPTNENPECTILDPTPGTQVEGLYMVRGIAIDSDGSIETVEVRLDDGPWVQVNGTTSWSREWDFTDVSEGNHTLYARSYDGTNYSEEVSVTVIVEDSTTDGPPESILQQAWFWVAVIVLVAFILIGVFVMARKS